MNPGAVAETTGPARDVREERIARETVFGRWDATLCVCSVEQRLCDRPAWCSSFLSRQTDDPADDRVSRGITSQVFLPARWGRAARR